MSAPVLGYWDIRGLCEHIRFLLHYQGVKFVDKRYRYEEKESWFEKDKLSLGLDFPNLPYLIDGDVKLTQSIAILRYLARKYDLAGRTEEERVRVELAEQQITDFRANLAKVTYSPECESLKGDFIRSVPAHLKLFSAFLGDRKYFAGDDITYVDFMAYHFFDYFRLFAADAGVYSGFRNLEDFLERIERLPAIRKYMNSPAYKRFPIYLPFAYFGGKEEE